jgi:hypothetical protein
MLGVLHAHKADIAFCGVTYHPESIQHIHCMFTLLLIINENIAHAQIIVITKVTLTLCCA